MAVFCNCANARRQSGTEFGTEFYGTETVIEYDPANNVKKRTAINIGPAVQKLSLPPANGGAGVSFSLSKSGSATVVISPDEKSMSLTIFDAMGRQVMNAEMTGPKSPTPNQLVTWTCTQHNKIYNLANFGNVEQRNQIEQDGKITSSLIDGFGWGVGSLDQDLVFPSTKYPA